MAAENDVELQDVHVDVLNNKEASNEILTGKRKTVTFEDQQQIESDLTMTTDHIHDQSSPQHVTDPHAEQLHLTAFLGLSSSEILTSKDPEFVVKAENVDGEVLLHTLCRSWSFSADETIRIIKQIVEWDIQLRTEDDHLNHQNNPQDIRLKENKDGNIPLHIACSSGRDDYAIVEALLHCHKDDVDQATIINDQIEAETAYFKNTAVHIAAWYGNERILKSILKKAPNKELLLKKNVNGDSPVHLAAEKGNVRILEVMHSFHKECFQDNQGRLNWSPLHTACAFGQLEAVKEIVSLTAYGEVLDSNTQQKMMFNVEILTSSSCALDSKLPLQELTVPRIDISESQGYKISNNKNDESMTPLTLACMFGHADIVKFLLKVGNTIKIHQKKLYKPVNTKALIASLENNHEECLKLIVVHSKYKELIELLKMDHEKKNEALCQDYKVALFNKIIQKMPKVAKCILDKCVTFHDHSNLSYVTMEYALIHPTAKDSGLAFLIKEKHPLKTMIRTDKNVELLKHPVVSSFLYNRWNSKYGVANFLYWLMYFIYLLFVTYTLVWVLPAPSSNYCGTFNETHDVDNEPATHSTPVVFMLSNAVILHIMAALILVYSSFRLFFSEFFQFLSALHFSSNITDREERQYWLKRIKNFSYIWDYCNWFEIPLFILSIAFAIIIFNANSKSFCLSEVEWQVGVIITCLSWIELVLISRQFKFVGVQSQTFCRVFTTLIKFAPFAVFLFAAFGISFYLLLRQSMTDKKSSLYSRSPFHSMLSMYAMLGGYVEPENVFELNRNHLYYEVFMFLFWAMSLLFITVILSNIMIGLAVSDINEIFKEADFERLKLQVHNIVQTGAYEVFLGSRRGSLIGKPSTNKKYNRNQTTSLDSLKRHLVFFLWGGTHFLEDSLEEVQQCQNQWPTFEIRRRRQSSVGWHVRLPKR